MLVMDLIADILKREGVRTLFCYPTTPIIEAAAAAGIRPIVCRQERAGVDMASGFSRVSNGRELGVFAMQYGPGAENAFPGIASAYSDSVPILLLPLAHGRDVSQLFPLFRSVRTYASVTKTVEEITLPGETRSVMRRAFSQLKNGRLGPVMVEVPVDVVQAEIGSPPGRYEPVRRARSAADEADVERVARLLLEASSPIIQAGQGILYAQASAELTELAELAQIPVMTTVDGKSAFPETHPLSLGAAGNVMTGDAYRFLHQADLVFGIGTSLTRHSLVNPHLPPGVKVIHATNDSRDFDKCYDTEALLLGDARLVLSQLNAALRDRLGKRPRKSSASSEIKRLRESWLVKWQPKLDSSEVPINPYRVISEFMRVVDPADAIVTHDSGSPRDQILPFYKATRPRSYLGWGKSHQLGTGQGLMLGAKLAAPGKFCVNFMGDAAFGMTGLDFETAVRCNVPTLTVVLNNGTMAIETANMKLSHELYRARDVGGSYANLARELGGWSERISDPEQVGDAILRARRKTQEGHTALLEFMTCAETAFSHRKGAPD